MSIRWRFYFLVLILTACAGEDENYVPLQVDWVFGDHMVLQREKDIVISGKATEGQQVHVQLGEDSRIVSAGPDNRFEARLPSRVASETPMSLRIQCGDDEFVFKNVVIGDVWLVAGSVGIPSDVPSDVRVCRRQRQWISERRVLTENEFDSLAKPEFAASHWAYSPGESARTEDAWLAFGETLSADLAIPVGLIDVSCPGSLTECWIPHERLAEDRLLHSLAGEFPESALTPIPLRGLVRSQLREWILGGRKAPRPPHYLEPSYLYSAVIEEVSSFSLCGVTWRTSSQTMREPWLEERLTRTLIDAWRESFNDPELCFLIQELPTSSNSQAPLYRERQRALRDLGSVKIATSFDLESSATQQLGERLARASSASPTLEVELFGEYLIIKEESVEKSHWAVGSEGAGFELAGPDLRFFPAVATLVAGGFSLHALEVPQPIAARFAWAASPAATLLDKNGVPLAPFRSHPVTPIKVACIGDSLTFGFGLHDAAADAYPIRLAKLLGDRFLVRNFSRSATTAAGTRSPGAWNPVFAETREYGQALAFEPDVIVCNLGTNDLTHWLDSGPQRAQQFEAEYADLLAAFDRPDGKPELYLWSPIAPLYPGQVNHGDAREAELNEALSRLTERLGAHEIDMHASCGERAEWFPDKLHPDPSGCRAIAAAVHAQLGDTLQGVAVPKAPTLRILCVQGHYNWNRGLPPQSTHASDGIRLAFHPRVAGSDHLILGKLSESPRLRELARALWDRGMRNFALLPFEGDGLEARLTQIERELPRHERTEVIAVIARSKKFASVTGCENAILLAPNQFDSPQALVDRLLELQD